MSEHAKFEKTFTLAVPVAKAWQAFTDPELIEVWLTGKVAEADSVIARLLPAEPGQQSAAHDFRDGMCRKCGSSQGAAERFGWGCW